MAMTPKNENCSVILERVLNADALKIFLILTGRVIIIKEKERLDFRPNAQIAEKNNDVLNTARVLKFFLCVPIK